jgi:hypothetical protein
MSLDLNTARKLVSSIARAGNDGSWRKAVVRSIWNVRSWGQSGSRVSRASGPFLTHKRRSVSRERLSDKFEKVLTVQLCSYDPGGKGVIQDYTPCNRTLHPP